jgi:AcrR family transcriptional regulator
MAEGPAEARGQDALQDAPVDEREQSWLHRVAVREVGKASGMGRSAEYRHFAARSLEIARATKDERTRAVMLQMAQVWSRLADEAETMPDRGSHEANSD